MCARHANIAGANAFFANLRLRSPIGAVQITQQVAQSNKLSFFQSWPTEKSHDATAMHWRYLAANCRLIGRRICDPTANPSQALLCKPAYVDWPTPRSAKKLWKEARVHSIGVGAIPGFKYNPQAANPLT